MTNRIVELGGNWTLLDAPIKSPATPASLSRKGWIACRVPGGVYDALIRAGRLPEPLIGLNSFKCKWIESRAWWFKRTFSLPAGTLRADAIELELDGLDANAVIVLNGTEIGRHPSTFYPFVADVRAHLRPGRNTLAIRLTHGVEHVNPADATALGGHVPTEAEREHSERGDVRRVFVRKPQYSWGWDWSPRLATVGITAPPRLRVIRGAALRDVAVEPKRRGRDAELCVTACVDWIDPFRSGDGELRITLTDPDGHAAGRAAWQGLLQSGENSIRISLPVRHPRLWWPAGMGRQDRYTIDISLTRGGKPLDGQSLHYGIRFMELDTRGTFRLRVNDRPVFARGANWIPEDADYTRVSDRRIASLVAEAAAANFTMLRVWGGGRYEPDSFYEACDRHGILVWQDFMFACAPYPDDRQAFRDDVAREAAYQTRRLRNRACLALWCGSNELLYCLGIGGGRETRRGTELLGHVLPRAVQGNCPWIPYWYTSPSGGQHSDDPAVGDVHYWTLMMNGEMALRIDPHHYDACDAHFVSEFGYPGPCTKPTVLRYLGGAPFDRTDATWQHHNNTFERETVDAGIGRHYRDAKRLSPDDYLLFGGLAQGVMLGYALEAMRFRADCHGGLFWMFNDCWGEVGWTIVDHDLRRKIAYNFVRRAFAPLRLILRPHGRFVHVVLANGTNRAVSGRATVGTAMLDGDGAELKRVRFTAAANERTTIARLPRRPATETRIAYVAQVDRPDVLPASWLAYPFRELGVPEPKLDRTVARLDARSCRVTVSSHGFAHGVHIVHPDHALAEDNYFDLLPGETRTVTVRGKRPLGIGSLRVVAIQPCAGGVGAQATATYSERG